MKKTLWFVGLILAAALIVKGQSTNTRLIGGPAVWSVDSSVTLAQCPTPPVSSFSYCQYGSGAAYSSGIVGDPNCPTATATCWIQYLPMPKTTAGVASVSVNGATPQTGAVVLKIPTTATSTASFATNGAATVTTTIQ